MRGWFIVRRCIAIINNESAVVRLPSDLLHDAGYATTVWTGGMDAHEMVRRERPDPVVLDISIDTPTSGLVLLDLLKLDFATRDIPVVACTTNLALLRGQEERLCDLRCIVLPKPYSFEQLQESIERAWAESGRDEAD